jgi:hypothetical protein
MSPVWFPDRKGGPSFPVDGAYGMVFRCFRAGHCSCSDNEGSPWKRRNSTSNAPKKRTALRHELTPLLRRNSAEALLLDALLVVIFAAQQLWISRLQQDEIEKLVARIAALKVAPVPVVGGAGGPCEFAKHDGHIKGEVQSAERWRHVRASMEQLGRGRTPTTFPPCARACRRG